MASDDGELVRRALAAGSGADGADACEQLVHRWSGRVLAVCRARVRSLDAAEDLAQEALLRGLRGMSTLAAPDKFGPWLCGIAHRTCLDWLKDARRTEVSYDALADPPQPEAIEEDREESQRLMAEVERLPEPYRETVMLYYALECTYEELGRLLGVSAAAVNARLTKARKMLRERLVDRTV